ncbi:uncharacterized protein [Populus alba]|uniref:uncharacterized protein n=1 Tax=Populus alba TaxID=43335 RepID=UPI003CC72F07
MRLKYQGSTKVKRTQLQALRREFEILGMKEGEKIDEYFARTLTIANKMKAHGERMEQTIIIEKILRSMTLKFNYVKGVEEDTNTKLKGEEDLVEISEAEAWAWKLGHFQYECPSGEKGANYAELDEEEEMFLMAYVEENQSTRENVWFLDSGCSNHMCGIKDWFFDLDETFRQSVKLGDNSRMLAMGKGHAKLHINGLT